MTHHRHATWADRKTKQNKTFCPQKKPKKQNILPHKKGRVKQFAPKIAKQFAPEKLKCFAPVFVK